jgi:hypothetical protein
MAFTDREIAIVKGMLARGDKQHDVASYFGVNGGRVAEVATEKNGAEIRAAAKAELPPPGPYIAGRSALHARDTLAALRDLIDGALHEIDLYERGRSQKTDGE